MYEKGSDNYRLSIVVLLKYPTTSKLMIMESHRWLSSMPCEMLTFQNGQHLQIQGFKIMFCNFSSVYCMCDFNKSNEILLTKT